MAAAQRLHALAGPPGLHGVVGADVVGTVRAALAALARGVALGALVEVLDQRAQCRHAGDDDAEVVLDRRPQDQRRAVGVIGQPLHGLDADDLDDGDEDAESEEAQEDELLRVWM